MDVSAGTDEELIDHEDEFEEISGGAPLPVDSEELAADEVAEGDAGQGAQGGDTEGASSGETAKSGKPERGEREVKAAELEQVMTSGMQFLAGLFKMSTGKDMGLENQQIKVNEETGEVTMTFKLPL